MSESTLIQQQRDIMHTVHQVMNQGNQAAVDIKNQLQQARRSFEEVGIRLSQEGLQDLLEQVRTSPILAQPGANANHEFSRAISTVNLALSNLAATFDGPMTQWQEVAFVKGHGMALSDGGMREVRVAFSPDGQFLVSGGSDSKIKLWNLTSREQVHVLDSRWRVYSLAFSPDSQLLVASASSAVFVWDFPNGKELGELKGHGWAPALSLAFSPDGRVLAAGCDAVKLWDLSDPQKPRTLKGHKLKVRSVAFSPNGQILASGSMDKTVKLWDLTSGKELRTFSGHTKGVFSVAFSPDGQTLASGGDDNTVKLWDVTSGRELYSLRGHTKWVFSLAFSPDGQMLASGSDDKTVRLWKVSTGQLLCSISTERAGRVASVAFSPDGQTLAVGGDGKIIIFQGTWPDLPSQLAFLVQAVADAEFWYEHRLDQVVVEYQHKAQIQTSEIYQQWLSDFNAARQPVIVPWEDTLWQQWAPTPDSSSPLMTRLGVSQFAFSSGQPIRFPTFFTFPGEHSLFFKATGPAKASAVQAIQSLLLRLLAMTPPGKLRFTFIDPVGLGQNVAPFMHLADYDEALVTGKAWAEPQQIEQRLADLTEHMENVIQKYLRNQFATIEDYNAQAGEVAEPYRVLVVLNFPVNCSEAAARRLVSIAQNGPRCGVYAVMLADTDKPLPYGFNLADLEQDAVVIAWDGTRFVWQDEDFKDCLLELDTPPDAALFDRILQTVGEAAKAASKVEVPFEKVLEQANLTPNFWWGNKAFDGIKVPLGPAGANRLQYLDLGVGTAQHALVAGKTGSGKSTLLHVLINNLALAYSPNEVELYLVDFKKGVEFKAYAVHQLPHARVIAIESEREFGLSVLQGLDAELKRRGDLFRTAGADGLADYRRKSGQPMPRTLLLVDEFQEFFTEDDATALQAAQILDRLVRQGRAFGIHVLLGSQTLAGAYSLARSTIDQMAVRIALQCSEADSRLILADDNPAARLLSRPGEAIYNAANGMVEGNNRFQVAWLPDEGRDHYLGRVQTLAQERGYRPSQIVFEGNAPAEMEKNRPLSDLLTDPAQPALPRTMRAWLGEPIAIREPVAALFRRQSGSNLLIVGQNNEAALSMMAVSLIGLAAQLPTPAYEPGIGGADPFYILDFSAVDAPHADFFTRLTGQVPHLIKIGRRRQLPEIINTLAVEVQRRLDAEEAAASPICLFLYGLQRARDLRQEEMFGLPSFSDEPAAPNPAQQFTIILREGPDVGVHTLVWCDTATNLNRSLDRRTLREFAMRVVFQMSAEDSVNLIDTPVANKLGLYRALFYNEEEGRLEKFRPYALPSVEWLQWVGEQLLKKK